MSAFFSCHNLNAGLEPRVCDICAMRLPRLRPLRLTLKPASPCAHALSQYTLSLHGLLSLALSFSLLSLILSLDFLLSLSLSL